VTYCLAWFEDAVRDLANLPSWDDAERVDKALQQYARTGRGFVRRVETERGIESRLYVRGCFATIAVDEASKTIHVWRIHPISP
jgi:hypothetical protein